MSALRQVIAVALCTRRALSITSPTTWSQGVGEALSALPSAWTGVLHTSKQKPRPSVQDALPSGDERSSRGSKAGGQPLLSRGHVVSEGRRRPQWA